MLKAHKSGMDLAAVERWKRRVKRTRDWNERPHEGVSLDPKGGRKVLQEVGGEGR